MKNSKQLAWNYYKKIKPKIKLNSNLYIILRPLHMSFIGDGNNILRWEYSDL